jgi:hypothetical protein
MSVVKENLRRVRKMHIAFVSTWFLFLLVLHQLKPMQRPVPVETSGALAAVAIVEIFTSLRLRARQLTPAIHALRANPEDADAMRRWYSGNIVSFTFAEVITLLGVALKFMGAGWNIAGGFFAVGLLLLVVWTPRLDVQSQ